MFANNFTLNPVLCENQTVNQKGYLILLARISVDNTDETLSINSQGQITITILKYDLQLFPPSTAAIIFYLLNLYLGNKTDIRILAQERELP